MGKGNGSTRAGSGISLSPSEMNDFEERVVDYVINDVFKFTDRELSFMEQNMKKSDEDLLRIEEVDSRTANLKVGDSISFDRFRSFNDGLDGFEETLSNFEDYFSASKCIAFQVRKGKGYNISPIVEKNADNPMLRYYLYQNEVLTKGRFKVVGVKHETYYASNTGTEYRLKTYIIEPN